MTKIYFHVTKGMDGYLFGYMPQIVLEPQAQFGNGSFENYFWNLIIINYEYILRLNYIGICNFFLNFFFLSK